MTPPKILPPVYFVLCILLMGALHLFAPIYRLIDPPFNFLGLIPLVAGIAISAFGSGQFKKAGTPIVPFERSTALVTSGLYRFTRNPMYVGFVTALIGIAIVCGTVGALLPIPIFSIVIHFLFIKREEHFLVDLFGDSYQTYRRSVRRWL